MLKMKRKTHIVILTLIFLFCSLNALNAAQSIRCGNDLVSIGDFSFRVNEKCGEPISKEVIGYTIKNNEREFKIELWVYGPRDGVYYYLKFEGGKLVEITTERD